MEEGAMVGVDVGELWSLYARPRGRKGKDEVVNQVTNR